MENVKLLNLNPNEWTLVGYRSYKSGVPSNGTYTASSASACLASRAWITWKRKTCSASM
jgi:hypothetical protein